MSMEGVASEVESSLRAWLSNTGCLESIEQARAVQGAALLSEPVLVQVNILELATLDPALAQLLLDGPDEFRQLVHSVLVSAGKLHAAERLWLRPCSAGLLTDHHTCMEAVELLRSRPGCMVAVHGICSAASATFYQRYSRIYECTSCGAECIVLEGQANPDCCGVTVMKEHQARGATMQSQVIYLTQEPSAGWADPALGEPSFAIHLHDDQCGRARPGDHLLVLGIGRHVLSFDANSATYGCRPTMQMEAVGLEVLPPQGPALPFHTQLSLQHQHPIASPAFSSLDSLLGALGCCFDAPCKPLLRLALLLSAASAGVHPLELSGRDAAVEGMEEDDDFQQQYSHRSRAQVNLLLLCKAPEPHLSRLLQQAAAGPCQHSVQGGVDAKQLLLPRLFPKYVEPSLAMPPLPMALGGQLAAASSGVLLLNSQLLPKQGAALADCLRVGTVALTSDPALALPLRTTIWFSAEEQDSVKLSKAGGNTYQGGEGCSRLAAKYGRPFLSFFDIQLDCSSEDPEDLDLWADQLLSTAQRQQQTVQATCGSSTAGGGTQHAAVARVECDALAALQAHLRQAVKLPAPRMSPEAMALLSGYFCLIRVEEEAQQGLLESMARVATACARLCHRQEVLDFPDATVAVMFLEEQLIARGAYANHWCKGRDELAKGTDLLVCLELLRDDLHDCLGAAFAGAAEE